MSADQDDLFEAPRAPDLRSPLAWPVTSGDAHYGWWVRTSWCGRFTICGGGYAARAVLFRRNVVNGRWNPPDIIDGFLTLEEAFEAAAKLVEAEAT